MCIYCFIFCMKGHTQLHVYFLSLLLFPPDPVVSYRSISALPHSLHVPSPGRQMVASYHPQCAACCRARPAGPALPHQPSLFYETCSQGTSQRRQEEKVARATAMDFQDIPHTVTRLMSSGNSPLCANCIKQTIVNPKPRGNLKMLL